MPKISVVVPVYNVARYLPECLDSLISQTLNDIEIICVNDGSTDNSLDILNEYAGKDSRFKVISTKNYGYGHAMNTGFVVATGEYIGILESDDFTASNMYEDLWQVAVSNDADIVKSNYWDYLDGNKELVRSLNGGPYDKVFTPRQDEMGVFWFTPSIWSAIYKREFIINHDIKFNETPGASFQDTSFNFMVLACAERMVLKEDAYICYRRDNESSSVKSLKKVYCVFDEYEYIDNFLSSKGAAYSKLEYLLPALAWNTYSWNYGRISVQFKYAFLEKMIDYFYDLWDKGNIRPSYWRNKEHLAECTRILVDKSNFLHRVYAGLQEREVLLNHLRNTIQNYSCVYIYGAGKVGVEVAHLLEKHELCFDGFVVTNKGDNVKEIMGKKIIPLKDIDDIGCGADSLFILSVKETTQPEILFMLREKGYKNIIAMTNEMRKYMVGLEQHSIQQLVSEFF